MNHPSIDIDQVKLSFGATEALKGVTAQIEPGHIVGLIGRNGAGKSTLLEVLAGLLVPDSGHSRLLGHDCRDLPDEVRQRMGFVFQQDELFGWMKVDAHIDVVGAHYRNWDEHRARELAQRWDIPMDQTVASLSGGQRQKLGILLAIVHQPDVLLLDEPASALDPVSRRAFLAELVELACDGHRSMVLSSHLIGDIERLADRIWLMRQGELVLDEPLDDLKDNVIRLNFQGTEEPVMPESTAVLSRKKSEHGSTVIARHPGSEALAELQQKQGHKLRISTLNLEDLALELL
ncbi:MAG: ABC transporter ATP-binding protein [Wenzhouxiangella sp.]